MTTNEIATIPSAFVNPQTGEVIDVSDPDALALAATQAPDVLAMMLSTIDEHIREAQDARAYIGQFLIDRMDTDATQTLHAGEYTLTVNGSSDEYETHDADALAASLATLVEAGIIGEAAAEKAIRTKREVAKTGLNSLRALRKPEIDAAIKAATMLATRRRRITVKR